MPTDRETPHIDAQHDDLIQPAEYAPPTTAGRSRKRRPDGRNFAIVLILAAALLFAWFLLSSRPLLVRLSPETADFSIEGGISLRLGPRVLLRPGSYALHASAPGYEDRVLALTVNDEVDQSVEVRLEKLPGRLAVSTTPVPARVFVDDAARGMSNADPIPVPAGVHRVRLEADRYVTQSIEMQVEGMAVMQTLDVRLEPGWGVYQLDSTPSDATVFVDGTEVGRTPLQLELLAGRRQLTLKRDGYRSLNLEVDAAAGAAGTLASPVLKEADGKIDVTSEPAGASITLDGEFQGTTPLEISLESGRPHEIVAFRSGYQRAIRRVELASGEKQSLRIALKPVTGEISVEVEPADAEVLVGGRLLGRGSQSVTLPASAQVIEVRREGFAAQRVTVTPRPGFDQTIRVRLLTQEQHRRASIKSRISTSLGQELVLLRPGPYTMGSSRREPGRRANEGFRKVDMQRAFYLGVSEVTNAEFRRFRPEHSSGNFKGKSLNGETQPVASISWDQAAHYCNWLSKKDGLQPFYRIENGTVVGFDAASAGYRLPTEAEWEWVARMQADGSLRRFGWGDQLPPTKGAGNYGDRSGATLLAQTLADYDDGYPVSAPARSFAANRHGVFDIDGNAAEWVHDYYEAAAGMSVAGQRDPMGPEVGEFHVIRGASWRTGAVTELRLSFRDYGKEGRADVGFRLARYLE